MSKTFAEQWEDANKQGAKRYIATGYHHSDGWYELSGIVNTGRVLDILQRECFTDRHIPIENNTLLELGCGNGRMTKYLANVFGKVVAVDCSLTVIRMAQSATQQRNVQWVVNDGESLKGVPDQSIDVVFSYIVFQHMKQETVLKYFAEIARVLKTGGTFIFQLPVDNIIIQNTATDPEVFNGVASWSVLYLNSKLRELGFEFIVHAASALDYHLTKKI